MPSFQINKKLNPYFETFFLLSSTPFDEKSKQETIAKLDEFGVDGESFYQKHFAVVEKYFTVFEANRVPTECDIFLATADIDYFMMLAIILTHLDLWTSKKLTISEKSLQTKIIEVIYLYEEEIPPQNVSLEDAIAQIDRLEFSGSVKWQITRLLQRPKDFLQQLIQAVQLNIPAFEAAQNANELEIQILLDNFEKGLQNEGHLREATKTLAPDAPVTPTLAAPLSILIFLDHWYYGLLCEYIQQGDRNAPLSREEILISLKSISDKTKLEILTSLKEQPKYNLELAEQLNLTPATISHHMGALLNSGFVKIEKKGKSYYTLNEKSIEHFIHALRLELLK